MLEAKVMRSSWALLQASTERRTSLPRVKVTLLAAMLLSNTAQPLTLHDVPRDGDCLFSAIALSVALVDRTPAQARARALRTAAERLRNQAVELLCPNGIPDENLILGELPAALLMEPLYGEGEAGYCQRMRQRGEWGTSAEVVALTRVLMRPIHVYTSFGAAPQIYGADEAVPSPQHLNELVLPRPLTIFYDAGANHYQAATVMAEAEPKSEL